MKSFEIDVQDYCEYCPHFTPDINKIDVTKLSDTQTKSVTIIRCEMKNICERVYINTAEMR